MQINELAKALSQAQLTIKAAERDMENPFFKSKYASLESVWNACKDPLIQNGLAISQCCFWQEEKLFVKTILMHSSGQYVESHYPVFVDKQSPQAYGASLTYARRYSLAAIVGVPFKDEDDDAESATKRTKEEVTVQKDKAAAVVRNFAQDVQKTMDNLKANPALGEYVCQVGKFKDKAVKDISKTDFQSYKAFMEGSGKPPGGQLKKFFDIGSEYYGV